MRALVTGATGFLGANLVEALSQRGWQVRALHRKTSSLKALQGLTYESALGDITEPESLTPAMRDVDVVFHAAAVADYWRAGVKRLYQVNVDGTRAVLRAAGQAGVSRVVFVSSVAALGRPPFGQPLNESAQFNLRPEQFHYGYSKALAESHVRAAVADGLDAVIVNPAVIVGPRDVNLISGSLIIEAARSPARLGIPFYPPGGVCVIDVADVCAGCIAAAERGRTGERYILGGENLWHRQMIRVVCEVVGRPQPVLPLPSPLLRALGLLVDLARDRAGLRLPFDGQQARFSADTFWFDSSKARRELGLTTRPFVEAARRTYTWYRQNGYL